MSLANTPAANGNAMPTPRGPADADVPVPQPAPETTPAPAPEHNAAFPNVPAGGPEQPQPTPEQAQPAEQPQEGQSAESDLPFEPTGNAATDGALTVLAKGGVDFNKAFSKFAQTGNDADIDRDYIKSVVGEATAAMVEQVLKDAEADTSAAAKSQAQETADLIHTTVGGQEVWEAISGWVGSGKSGLDQATWNRYANALQEGGFAAELAAQDLKRRYEASPEYSRPIKFKFGDTSAAAPALEGISRVQYHAELKALAQKGLENSPEAELLHRRREATIQRGI